MGLENIKRMNSHKATSTVNGRLSTQEWHRQVITKELLQPTTWVPQTDTAKGYAKPDDSKDAARLDRRQVAAIPHSYFASECAWFLAKREVGERHDIREQAERIFAAYQIADQIALDLASVLPVDNLGSTSETHFARVKFALNEMHHWYERGSGVICTLEDYPALRDELAATHGETTQPEGRFDPPHTLERNAAAKARQGGETKARLSEQLAQSRDVILASRTSDAVDMAHIALLQHVQTAAEDRIISKEGFDFAKARASQYVEFAKERNSKIDEMHRKRKTETVSAAAKEITELINNADLPDDVRERQHQMLEIEFRSRMDHIGFHEQPSDEDAMSKAEELPLGF